jgi:uncharacterized membrane protein YbhN (UPF0104 family)
MFLMDDSKKASSSLGKKILNAGKAALALFLVWFVVSQTDFAQLRDTLNSISIPWLGVYTILFILAVMAKALQYKIVIGREVTYTRVLSVVVMQNVVSNFLAASAGVASYVALLRVEHGVKVSRAMIAFILTKVGDLTAIFILLLASLLGGWSDIEPVKGLTLLLLMGMGGFLASFGFVVLFRERFVTVLRSVFERIRLTRFGLVNQGLDILDALAEQDQVDILRTMGRVLAGSFLYLAVTLPWLYSSMRMFSIHLNGWEIAFTSAFYYLVTYVPVQIFGGLGVTEAGMMYIYHLFGPSLAELAAILIGLRVLSALMNLSLLLYLPLYGFLSHTKSDNL